MPKYGQAVVLVNGETNGSISIGSAVSGDYGAVSVGVTATRIITGRSDLKGVIITPLGTTYIGIDSNVTVNTGEILYSGDVFSDSGTNMFTGDIYGIAESGSVNVRYQRRW